MPEGRSAEREPASPSSAGRRAWRRLSALRRSEGAGSRLALPPAPETPWVTVVVPVDREDPERVHHTLHTLAHGVVGTPYEVLLVGEPSQAALLGVTGHRLAQVPSGTPAARALAVVAREARAEHVLLLAAGAEPRGGWLEACLALARERSGLGVVGGRVTDPEGRVLEAGSVIWADGTWEPVGLGDDGLDYRYGYVRDVDFLRTRAALVRRDLLAAWAAEPAVTAGPYADADLACTARARGLRVLFQPRGYVVVPEGSDQDATPEEHDRRAAFQGRWQAVLDGQRPRDDRHRALAARAAAGPRAHVLVVDFRVPRFDRDAGSLRMMRLLELLGELGFAVTLLPEYRYAEQPYTAMLQDQGVQVAVGDVDERGLIASLAPDLAFVILSRAGVAWRYVPMVRELAPAARVLFDTVDLHHVREQRRADLEGDPAVARVAEVWRELELCLVRVSDGTLVVSDAEREVVEAECPGAAVWVVPTVHDVLTRPPAFQGRAGLLFVGGFAHPPNVDGVVWFVEEVLPLVREQLPQVRLTIAGDAPPAAVTGLAGPSVEVLGWVEDLAPLHDRARVFVAPLRYGAGVKGKVLESLAYGLPVVSTRVGAEGVGVQHGRDVLLAETAGAFAAEVVRLYRDAVLWERLAAEGRRRVQEGFSRDAVRARLGSALASLAARS